jgi:hypothetical protein
VTKNFKKSTVYDITIKAVKTIAMLKNVTTKPSDKPISNPLYIISPLVVK